MNHHIWEKKKKLCFLNVFIFLWQLFLDKSSPRPIWNSWKTLHTPWILSLKRTYSHIGRRSSISCLLVLRGHLKKSILIFSVLGKWNIVIWNFLVIFAYTLWGWTINLTILDHKEYWDRSQYHCIYHKHFLLVWLLLMGWKATHGLGKLCEMFLICGLDKEERKKT